jgi:hypothetical protein
VDALGTPNQNILNSLGKVNHAPFPGPTGYPTGTLLLLSAKLRPYVAPVWNGFLTYPVGARVSIDGLSNFDERTQPSPRVYSVELKWLYKDPPVHTDALGVPDNDLDNTPRTRGHNIFPAVISPAGLPNGQPSIHDNFFYPATSDGFLSPNTLNRTSTLYRYADMSKIFRFAAVL